MTVNGKAKGARAELEVVRLITAWWAQIEPEATFKRTPGSGGWAKGKGREKFGTSADLVTSSKIFPFAVEAKHRQAWSLGNVLAGKRSPVWGWWDQAIDQALETKKVPMLWFRKNHEPWRILLPYDYPIIDVRATSIPVTDSYKGFRVWPSLYLASDVLSVSPHVLERPEVWSPF